MRRLVLATRQHRLEIVRRIATLDYCQLSSGEARVRAEVLDTISTPLQ